MALTGLLHDSSLSGSIPERDKNAKSKRPRGLVDNTSLSRQKRSLAEELKLPKQSALGPVQNKSSLRESIVGSLPKELQGIRIATAAEFKKNDLAVSMGKVGVGGAANTGGTRLVGDRARAVTKTKSRGGVTGSWNDAVTKTDSELANGNIGYSGDKTKQGPQQGSWNDVIAGKDADKTLPPATAKRRDLHNMVKSLTPAQKADPAIQAEITKITGRPADQVIKATEAAAAKEKSNVPDWLKGLAGLVQRSIHQVAMSEAGMDKGSPLASYGKHLTEKLAVERKEKEAATAHANLTEREVAQREHEIGIEKAKEEFAIRLQKEVHANNLTVSKINAGNNITLEGIRAQNALDLQSRQLNYLKNKDVNDQVAQIFNSQNNSDSLNKVYQMVITNIAKQNPNDKEAIAYIEAMNKTSADDTFTALTGLGSKKEAMRKLEEPKVKAMLKSMGVYEQMRAKTSSYYDSQTTPVRKKRTLRGILKRSWKFTKGKVAGAAVATHDFLLNPEEE